MPGKDLGFCLAVIYLAVISLAKTSRASTGRPYESFAPQISRAKT